MMTERPRKQHTATVETVRGRYPYRPTCTCGHAFRGYASREAAQTMADDHQCVRMTKDQAYDIGRTAYQAGEPCAPTLNPQIREAIADLPVGAGAADIMQAFVQGWQTANLAAPSE